MYTHNQYGKQLCRKIIMPKEFKAHKMYGKGGVVKFVKTIKEHLALKEKGFGHTKKKE